MKGLETAIVQALRESGSADAQNRARIYQSARDALARAIAKQQLEGTESALAQKRKLEKLINAIEAQYQRAQEQKRDAARSGTPENAIPEPRLDPEPVPSPETDFDPRDEYPEPEPPAPPVDRPSRGRDAPPTDRQAAARRTREPVWPDDRPEPYTPVSDREPAKGQARRSPDQELEDFLFDGDDIASEPVDDDWPLDESDFGNDVPRQAEPPRAAHRSPDTRREPVEEDWPFDKSDDRPEGQPPPDSPKPPRRAAPAPRGPTEDDWPFDDADDRIDDRSRVERRQPRRRPPDAPSVSHAGERRSPPAGNAPPRRPATGQGRGQQDRQREPEPKRRRRRHHQQGAHREDPGFDDLPRSPAAEQPRKRRPDLWSEPDAGRATGRRAPPASSGKRRFPIYSLILVVALCIAFVGIGIWWFVIGGLGLSEEQRDTSVPNPPATVETENFAGSPRPQGRFGDEWITVFSADDITDVTENSAVSVELVESGGHQALRIQSRNPDEEGEAAFRIGDGVLQSMAGRESLIALTVRSISDEPTQIYVRCNLPGPGDCGRRRFDVSYEVQDVIFNVDLRGTTFSGGDGALLINSDVNGDERGIELFTIRIRPE